MAKGVHRPQTHRLLHIVKFEREPSTPCRHTKMYNIREQQTKDTLSWSAPQAIADRHAMMMDTTEELLVSFTNMGRMKGDNTAWFEQWYGKDVGEKMNDRL